MGLLSMIAIYKINKWYLNSEQAVVDKAYFDVGFPIQCRCHLREALSVDCVCGEILSSEYFFMADTLFIVRNDMYMDMRGFPYWDTIVSTIQPKYQDIVNNRKEYLKNHNISDKI